MPLSKNFGNLAAQLSVGVRFIERGVGAVQVAVGEAAWVAGPPVVALVGGGVTRAQVVVVIYVISQGRSALV
jgi:hypothetical protein